MSEKLVYHEQNDNEKQNNSLTTEEEHAFIKANKRAVEARKLGDAEHVQSSKEADQLINELQRSYEGDLDENGFNKLNWAEEDAKAKEAVLNKLRNGDINEQTITDLNYSLPNDVNKRAQYANEVKANTSEADFIKLKKVFDKKLDETNAMQLKVGRENPGRVDIFVTADYYSLYEALFGVTPTVLTRNSDGKPH